MPADYGSINTEPSAPGMINRYELERASGAQTLLKERHWDYNGVDMDYKMEETGVQWHMFISKRRDHTGCRRIMDQMRMNNTNGCISVHALMDQGQDACVRVCVCVSLCVFVCAHVYECL